MAKRAQEQELRIGGVTDHGGFSPVPQMDPRVGRLVFDDEVLTLDPVQNERFTREYAPIRLCETGAIAAMEITSEQVARSKLGAAAFFGVLGAVTCEGGGRPCDRDCVSQKRQEGILHHPETFHRIIARHSRTLDARERDHPRAPVNTAEASPASASDPAGQLRKVTELYRDGLLTDEEFAAKRAALIETL